VSSEPASQAAHPDQTLAFAACVAFVIDRLEGGSRFVTDSGGDTRWGISQRAYPELDIRHLTREAAVALYHRDYWLPVRGDKLPAGLDLLVFDAAVNQGVDRAARLLQCVLRIPEDGLIGPQTILAALQFRPAGELRALYSEMRLRWYTDLVTRHPGYTPYAYGWRCRVLRVADEAGARGGR
jgi:lysozyme family protein